MAKVSDGRVEKSQRRGRERKSSSNGLEKALEHYTTESPTTDSIGDDKQERRQVGIVIDGRTFTCATCKAGHRVGVCKHGKERPMKPTHPPGRPSAGQPKKVICDCPRDCTCAKKDCKCPRRCNCIQSMFMLVYIPAPGMEGDPQDDSGSWKIGEEVTTDLKGNILSPQQIQERMKQKEATKVETPGKVLSKKDTPSTVAQQPLSSSEARPVSSGGCCKHKQTVAQQNMVAKTTPSTDPAVLAVSKGCNCGSKCSCHFCPEHPNNSASINLARQQYMHFRNQNLTENSSMTQFMPDLPLGASCMGGQPRFMMSTLSTRPSAAQLAQTFGTPNQYGYIIGYPVEQLRDNGREPFSSAKDSHDYSDLSIKPKIETSGGLEALIPDQDNTQFDDSFGFSHDDFSIGDAFVASNGPDGWQRNLFAPENWPISPPTAYEGATSFNFQPSNPSPSLPYNGSSVQSQLHISPPPLLSHNQIYGGVIAGDQNIGYAQIGNGLENYSEGYSMQTMPQIPLDTFTPTSGDGTYG